jgi:hypothetical protein
MKEIQLTGGKVAFVDAGLFELLSRHSWRAVRIRNTDYAVRQVPSSTTKSGWTTLLMHQVVLPGVSRIDHKNQNGLDNRRENLRPATASQNAANMLKKPKTTSAFMGVCWNRFRNHWQASIRTGGAKRFLGYYDSEADAAHAYDWAANLVFGEFAHLNFPQEPCQPSAHATSILL